MVYSYFIQDILIFEVNVMFSMSRLSFHTTSRFVLPLTYQSLFFLKQQRTRTCIEYCKQPHCRSPPYQRCFPPRRYTIGWPNPVLAYAGGSSQFSPHSARSEPTALFQRSAFFRLHPRIRNHYPPIKPELHYISLADRLSGT